MLDEIKIVIFLLLVPFGLFYMAHKEENKYYYLFGATWLLITGPVIRQNLLVVSPYFANTAIVFFYLIALTWILEVVTDRG